MNGFQNEKELRQIVDNLNNSNNPETTSNLLQNLIFYIQNEGTKSLLPYMKNLVLIIETALKNENLTIIISASQLLLEIINSSPKDIESNFNIVAGQLCTNIGDTRPAVRKMALNNLLTFLKATQNSEIVISAILDHGIVNPNNQVKKQVILSLMDIIPIQSSMIITSPNFKNLIEKIIEFYNQAEDDLNSTISNVISYINKTYKSNFITLMKRLSMTSQDTIKRIIDESHNRNHSMSPTKEIGITDLRKSLNGSKLLSANKHQDNLENLNFSLKKFEKTSESILYTQIMDTNPNQPTLEYGLFPSKLIHDINNEDNWRLRADATEEMCHILEQVKSLDTIANHISPLLDLILKLVNDMNFKMCITAINMIGILLNIMPDKMINTHKEIIINNLLEKLGENKIVIRELSFHTLSLLIYKIPPQTYITFILPFLKNPNWHIRDECLALIRAILKQSAKLMENQVYLDIIQKVLEIIEDDKPKVRASALETIITLLKTSKRENELLIEIHNLASEKTYNLIVEKFGNPYTSQKDELNSHNPSNETSMVYSREGSIYSRLQSSAVAKRSTTMSKSPGNNLEDSNFNQSNDNKYNTNKIPTRTKSQNFNSGYDGSKNISEQEIYYTPNKSNNKNNYNNSPYEHSKLQHTDQLKLSFNSRFSPTKDMINDSGVSNNDRGRMGCTNNSSNNNNTFESLKVEDILKSRELNKYHLNSTATTVTTTATNNNLTTPLIQGKKPGNYDLSTASSSMSGNSQNPNTPFSFESTLSSSMGLGSKSQKQRFLPNLINDPFRIQSAQFTADNSHSPLKFNDSEKRIYSANEALDNKQGYLHLQNKLSNKIQKKEVYLDYIATKTSEDLVSSQFDKGVMINEDEESNQYSEFFSNYESALPSIVKNKSAKFGYEKTQNPYKTEKLQISSKTKDFIKHQEKDLYNELLKPYQKSLKKIPEIETKRETIESQNFGPFSTKENLEKRQNAYHRKVTSHTYITFEHEEITEKDESCFEENELEDKAQKGKAVDKDKLNSTKSTKRKIVKATGNSNMQMEPYQIDYKKQKYLTKEELTPIEGNAESTLKTILIDLKSDDWIKQFDAMNNLRRILCYHMNIINQQNFSIHQIIQEILKLIESLRSSLSKNAMITLTEMIQALKRQIDPELESIIMKLIKKSMDTNCFILDEVKKGLITLCQNCNENRIIANLFNLLNHKSIPAKINICLCFEAIIDKNEDKITQFRDFDKILIALAGYLLDGSLEVRSASKTAYNILLKNVSNRTEIDKILQKNFSEDHFSKIMQILNKEITPSTETAFIIDKSKKINKIVKSKSITPGTRTKENSVDSKQNFGSNTTKQIDENNKVIDKFNSLANTINKTIEFGQEDRINTTTKMKSSKMIFIKEGPEFENLPNLFTQADNSDWKSRYDAVGLLSEFGQRNADGLIRSKFATKYFDYFCKLLTDSNSKVSIYAITCFNDIIPLVKQCIENYSNNVMNTSFTLLGSAHTGIRSSAEIMFNNLIKTIDFTISIPCLCNGLLFANIKARLAILMKLIDNAMDLYERKPQLVTKNIIPTLVKMIDENKPELKSLVHKSFKTYYLAIGNTLMDYIPQSKISQINEILNQGS